MKKFCFSLLAVTCDHIPLIEVMYFLLTFPKDDKQYCYLSLECVLLPATSLASEEQTSFPHFFFLFVCLDLFRFCLSINFFFAMLIFFNSLSSILC